MTLAGKTALVTGGNRGIGLAVVRALALAGASVHFTARSAANIAAAQRALGPIVATGHHADMTDRLAMTTLFETRFDILINNAGIIGPIGRILDVSVEDWARNIDTNLTAAFHTTQLALAQMSRPGGTIVNATPIYRIDKENRVTIKDHYIDDLHTSVAFVGVNTEAGTVNIQVQEQVNPPDDIVVIQAIQKPWINLLWLGTFVLTFGFGMAMWRRIKENRAGKTTKPEEGDDETASDADPMDAADETKA